VLASSSSGTMLPYAALPPFAYEEDCLLLKNCLARIAFSALDFDSRKGLFTVLLLVVVVAISGFCPSKSSKTEEPPKAEEFERNFEDFCMLFALLLLLLFLIQFRSGVAR